MPEKLYLICINNPFRKMPYVFCQTRASFTLCSDPRYILECKNIVAYNFEGLIDILRELHETKYPNIIDIRTAIKLCVGKPKSSYPQNREPWQLRKILGSHLERKAMALLSDILDLKLVNIDEVENLSGFVAELMRSFINAWTKVEGDLKTSGEEERFFSIECPIYNIFIQTQLHGIYISQERLLSKLKALKTDYYRAVKALELNYGFLAQAIENNLKWADVEKYSEVGKSSGEIDSDFWRFIEIYGEFDPFLQDLYKARTSKIDYNALLRYNLDQYCRIYPRFDIMGTVTSRILVVSPGFQYLKKTSRSIIVPSEGHTLLYADFAQFEPGIVAHKSGDTFMIELYNSGDIYSALGRTLFGDQSKRKVAKILFLSFLYGMSRENLGRVIENISSPKAKEEAFSFFDKFETMCYWKEQVCVKAQADGFAASPLGNRRYIQQMDSMSSKEMRWVPNQIVQGTASLIFKKALIALYKSGSSARLLLPMHDAILVEVPTDQVEVERNTICEVLMKEFEGSCPSIRAKVTFERFDE